MVISESALLLLVIILLAVVPTVIVAAMLFAYDGEQSSSRRVMDTVLFYPTVTMLIGGYVYFLWFSIGDMGLGIVSVDGDEIHRWGHR